MKIFILFFAVTSSFVSFYDLHETYIKCIESKYSLKIFNEEDYLGILFGFTNGKYKHLDLSMEAVGDICEHYMMSWIDEENAKHTENDEHSKMLGFLGNFME